MPTSAGTSTGGWMQATTRLQDRDLQRRLVRVVRVDAERITLDRPLRIDARPEWQAVLHHYRPIVEEVGIENLTLEFPRVPKKKHLRGRITLDPARRPPQLYFRSVCFTNRKLGDVVSGSASNAFMRVT